MSFNKEYGKPIRDARCKNASSYAMEKGKEANQRLQEELKEILLRRHKVDFLSDELPPKIDTCVWVKASKQQTAMYKEKVESMKSVTQTILGSDKGLANKAKMTAFKGLAELINLCGHPLRLLKGGSEGCIHSALEQTSLTAILDGSDKLKLVLHMLAGFKQNDHKTLLFSQSTQNLDIIQHVLRAQNKRFDVARLDGSVSKKKRQDMVELFQRGQFDVLLLSTGAGGIGLTLTRASRVIVYDPSWNPAQDAQAVDRAYRIGQKQEVHIYRLFVAGSIEEKMYEKQVHKTGLETTIFTEQGGKPIDRYFGMHELCKVFAQVPDRTKQCEILKRFEQEGVGKVADPFRHDLVKTHNSVIGISNHSSIYGQKPKKGAFSDAGAAAAKLVKATTEERNQE